MSAPVVTLTSHPIQRTGAWAVAVLADRRHPDDLDHDDVRRVRDQLVTDLRRAAHAEDGGTAYDWWKVLFALYPNAPPTHAKRKTRPDLDQQIAELLDEDEPDPEQRCVFCNCPASVRWAKDRLPMFDTAKARNTLPPDGSGGWPVCWGCRVAVWAVPYGAAVRLGAVTVMTGGSERAERLFVHRNVQYAQRIQASGIGKVTRGTPERVVVAMLRDLEAREPVALWMFKNDNQEPWLRVRESRRPLARFIKGMTQDPAAMHGWGTLCRMLERRDRSGVVTELGADRAARTLFEPSERTYPVLLEEIFRQVEARLEHCSQRAYRALVALARRYAEEMLEMNLADVHPAAELVARWITATPNPRGRFNEYVKAARSRYRLGGLLMQAEARLLLDQRPGDPPLPMRAADAEQVLGESGDSSHRRMLLFFAVVDALVERGVAIGTTEISDEESDESIEETLRSGDEELEYEGSV